MGGAFSSADPLTIHVLIGVTGTFERLVNHLKGMLAAGARVAKLALAESQTPPSTLAEWPRLGRRRSAARARRPADLIA
jgi:hypothetical protein